MKRVSSIQDILYSILDDLDVEYHREYEDRDNDPQTVIGPYNFDCVIPRDGRPDLIIECNGDYWHSLPRTVSLDASKASYIANYYSGIYELKYLWEHEFQCKDRIHELVKYWLGKSAIDCIDFDFRDVVVAPSEAREYKLLLSKYHYLHNAGRGGTAYGAYLGDELIAACVFSPMVRQNLPWDNETARELSRLCIHPRYQKKNFASWFVSRCLKKLPSQYSTIISYCDTTFNHDGSVYKACNFVPDGEVPPDYWYVSEDGWVMHKKTLYSKAVQMKLTEKEYAERFGYKRVFGSKKLRFLYKRVG
jgi:GNAT superfamily N-acetyltransferase